MAQRNDGGPAYPYTDVIEWIECEGTDPVPHKYGIVGGMSLRDYFAAKAMQGLVAAEGANEMSCEQTARIAYLIANNMLEERETDMATPTPLNPHPRPDDLHSDRERWMRSEAGDHFVDALRENMPPEDAWLAVQAGREGDAIEFHRLVWRHVAPYLDAECEREVNQP